MTDQNKFKVGDKVAVYADIGGKLSSIRSVNRVMKRFVELDNGSKFNLNGYGSYPRTPFAIPHIKEATDEHYKELALRSARAQMLHASQFSEQYASEVLLEVGKMLRSARMKLKKAKSE